ncbi:hypothetical protein EV426DRAFT_125755 [Tirmania nivea]|nr:hypothetical protein EV426DRAFT_125755 [Tirmania nivea]
MSWLNTPNSQMSLSVESVDGDETDYYTDAPLPSPINTPYRTPQLSRKSSYQRDPSFVPSPPSGPGVPHHNRVSILAQDPSMDETISLLDPRRFTPTLHANLVAEILSLRRELESKAQFIDSLEHDLSKARSEQETATTSIASAQREAREVKRKLAAAENDSAVDDVVKERDNAVEIIGELRRQVERLTKNRRMAEEDAERTRKLAERDAERWEEVKRGLERRAHVAEGRLKMVLEELAAASVKPQDEPRPDTASETEGTETGSVHMAGSDTASIRTISRSGYRPQSFMAGDDVAERFGVRFSHLGFGQSLADELNFPEEESECLEEEDLEDDGEELVGEEEENDREDDEEEHGEDEADDYPSELEEAEGSLTPMQHERVPVATSEVAVQTEDELPQSPVTIIDPQQQLVLAEKEAELVRVVEQIMELESKLELREKEVAEWERQDAERCFLLREKEEKLAHTEHILAGKEQKLEEQDMRLEELSLFVETSLKEVTKENHMVTTGMQTAEAEAEAKRKSLPLSPPPKKYTTGSCQTDPHPPPRKILSQWPPKPPPKPPVTTGTQTAPSVLPTVPSAPPVSAGTQTDLPPSPPPTPKPIPPPPVSAGTQTDVPPPLPPPPPPVSSSTQTDLPPSPPPSPKAIPPPPVCAVTTGTQTEPIYSPPALNRATQPPSLLRVIPTIQVIPPPPTPPAIYAPPFMKDSAVQTSPPIPRSVSMQTDNVKVVPVTIKFAPTLLPSALLSSTAPLSLPDTGPAPSLPRRSSKRATRKTPPPAPVAQTPDFGGVILTEEPLEDLDLGATPPPIDKGKGKARDNFSGIRPSRISAIFPGSSLDMLGSSDDESLNLSDGDGEYKTVLSAPKPRKRLSRNPALSDKSNTRQSSIRRNALITSGSQAHTGASMARSPSSASGGTVAIGPPFPVPTRFSSRKVTPTGSERTDSLIPFHGITRNMGRNRRNTSLRKSRSATQLSLAIPQGDKSPPPLSAPTIAPEDPYPPLPRDEVRPRSPAFPTRSYETKFQTTKYDYRHDNKYDQKADIRNDINFENKFEISPQAHRSSNTSNTGNATVESAQQTSVVDAIAQTMVGEWMWKYVRRRRSFGVQDSPNGWDGKDDSAGGGQRHKRWVWLAPYERAVMWSSRQPTNGNALLGKSGRKRMNNSPEFPSLDRLLTKINTVPIQSVLDVKDDTPLPKGVNQGPVFNRSILILTPARALKFTAPTKERHYVWLTALSFLSHSAQEADGLLALPPPMPFEYEQVEQQVAHATPTRIITEHDSFPPPLRPRDSIRLAKGKKPDIASQASGGMRKAPSKTKVHAREDSFAEPPSVPRYPGQHMRKRSNTGSRPPNNRTIGFSGPGSNYAGSIRDSILFGNGLIGGIGILSANNSAVYESTAGGSSISGWDSGVGTVRMEAFVAPKRSELEDDSLYNAPNSYQQKNRQQKQGQWSPPNFDIYSKMTDDDFFRSHDPFRGF